MDIATIIGILAGFGCIIAALSKGGNPALFVDIPSVMITVGGMISATLIHFSLPQVLRITSVAKKALFCKLPGEPDLIQRMVNYSAISRRDGTLALEQHLGQIGDPFLVKALRMVVDGQTEQAVEFQLGMEVDYLQERHADGKKVLEYMGSAAPAFGMIGTLIGLVQMLANLSDPSQIGSGMAVALITTFYGAILANLVFIPLAGKVGNRSRRETLLCQMITQGVLGIVRGESPTEVRERMQTFISNRHREEYKPNI